MIKNLNFRQFKTKSGQNKDSFPSSPFAVGAQPPQEVDGRRRILEITLKLSKIFIQGMEKVKRSFPHSWKNSFSFAKRNFFKFELELILLILALLSATVNRAFLQKPPAASNQFLAYLLVHPQLNKNLTEQIKTENIHIVSEQENFIAQAQASTLDPLIHLGTTQLAEPAEKKYKTPSQLLLSYDSVIVKPNYATKDVLQKKDIQEYVVQKGDSISKIASQFGVSAQTILYENQLSEDDYIRPGQTLKILPTTGIKHTIKPNETLEQIAKKYQVDLEIILAFNEIEIPGDIEAGEALIIPDAKIKLPESQKSRIASLQRVDVKRAAVPEDFAGASGSLIWPLPTRNISQRYWSRHRGIDISNGQRPQFWATQGGIVELSGWEAGYGRTVVINHGGGVKTRYAHASELYVEAGDKIAQGQVIGRVGNTGRVYGRTGNHLHFEVIVNGLKVNPLGRIK